MKLGEAHVEAKVDPRGFQRGQSDIMRCLKASGTPQGPPRGAHLGGQNRSKPVTEAFKEATEDKVCVGRVWEYLQDRFLKAF